MAIQTVLGPIEPAQLGPTSMHEHLLADGGVWHRPPSGGGLPPDPSTLADRGPLSWDYLSSESNLRLDEPKVVIQELDLARKAGAAGIVDLTVIGLGRRVAELPRIARATDLHIMVGCGVYVQPSHPSWVADATVDALAGQFIRELDEGIDDTPVRAALIGEIGTSDPITASERKVLEAAGIAAAETGATVSVHQTTGRHGLDIIDCLAQADVETDRIVICHLDDDLDEGYHRALVQTGAVVEIDTFGHEAYLARERKWPSDVQRLDAVWRLLEAGYVKQVVLGCDVWTKGALRRYGGMGYEHLFRRVLPTLRGTWGASQADVDQMVIHTPRRLLDRPVRGPCGR